MIKIKYVLLKRRTHELIQMSAKICKRRSHDPWKEAFFSSFGVSGLGREILGWVSNLLQQKRPENDFKRLLEFDNVLRMQKFKKWPWEQTIEIRTLIWIHMKCDKRKIGMDESGHKSISSMRMFNWWPNSSWEKFWYLQGPFC